QPSHGVVTWAPGREASEIPFSTPPTPSEPPNSRILGPLTGNANKPLADEKASAGLSRPGSFKAARLALGSLGVIGLPRRSAVAAALAALLTSSSILEI